MPSEKILIIEDDDALLRGLTDNFLLRGYDVENAADGQKGLALALGNAPDLIILDLMLPKLNGYEVCQAIRRRNADVPIIMLTAKDQEEDVIRGLELGADDYVTKPFSIRELLARVKAFLRRHNAPPMEVYCFGDCRFEPAAHRLTRQDQEVALTTKEYQLLEYFLRKPGRALTRGEILNAVWGHSVIVTLRSIDRCVTTLRSKIELDPRRPTFIHTIRDIGYRFEPPPGNAVKDN
jgi:DNA-binding response OmpR family regulator